MSIQHDDTISFFPFKTKPISRCICDDTDVQQESITWSIFGSQVFFDEVQVLLAFEIVWMVGFVWCFFLKFPESIYSLFLRSEYFDECSVKNCFVVQTG